MWSCFTLEAWSQHFPCGSETRRIFKANNLFLKVKPVSPPSVGEGPRPCDDLQVAGGKDESVSQPLWAGSSLYFVSDRTDFWNIYTEESPGKVSFAWSCRPVVSSSSHN